MYSQLWMIIVEPPGPFYLNAKVKLFITFLVFINLLKIHIMLRLMLLILVMGLNFLIIIVKVACTTRNHTSESCVYTPQQNGLGERRHKHLLQICRSLMFQANLPKTF